MNAYTATLLNGFVLILMSAWGFFATQTSFTALIPAVFGIVFLLLASGVKANNKVVGHIVAVLAILVIIALVMPLMGTIGRGNTVGAMRVGAMTLTSIIAAVYYLKSFIDARKAKV